MGLCQDSWVGTGLPPILWSGLGAALPPCLLGCDEPTPRWAAWVSWRERQPQGGPRGQPGPPTLLCSSRVSQPSSPAIPPGSVLL